MPLAPPSNLETRLDVVEASAREVWDEAGLTRGSVRGVVPLREMLEAYNLRLIEVPGLTYEIAAREVWRELGRTLATRKGANRSLAGFLYAEANDGLILVKREDTVARRRFSIAHELGHFKMHRHEGALVLTEALFDPSSSTSSASEVAPDEGDQGALPQGELGVSLAEGPRPGAEEASAGQPSADDLARMEREANAFAARLLMPEQVCRQLLAEHRARFGPRPEGDEVAVRRLASALLVSPEAMRYRLRELGLIQAKPAAKTSRRRA